MSRLIFSLVCVALAAVVAFSAGGAVLAGGGESPWQFLLGENKQGLNDLLAEREITNKALANAERIKNKIAELEAAKQEISQADLDKLSKFIPNHLDNVNLIIDINNIATKHGMSVKNVKVSSGEIARTAGASAGAGNLAPVTTVGASGRVQTAGMSFSITGNYQALVGFLDDLASSLRVIDPVSLAFTVDEKGLNQYNFEIRTYWVK